jgi:hypothetical protein
VRIRDVEERGIVITTGGGDNRDRNKRRRRERGRGKSRCCKGR